MLKQNKSQKRPYYPLSRKIVLFFNNWCFLPFITLKGEKKHKASFDVRAFYSAPACLHQSFTRRNPFFFLSVRVCACVEGVWRGHCLNWIIDWKTSCQKTVPYKRNRKTPTWKTGQTVDEKLKRISNKFSLIRWRLPPSFLIVKRITGHRFVFRFSIP